MVKIPILVNPAMFDFQFTTLYSLFIEQLSHAATFIGAADHLTQ